MIYCTNYFDIRVKVLKATNALAYSSMSPGSEDGTRLAAGAEIKLELNSALKEILVSML
jgi:hypothetical protein